MTSMDESLPLLVEIALKARSKSRRKGQGLSLNCQVGLNKAPIFGLEVIFIQMDFNRGWTPSAVLDKDCF